MEDYREKPKSVERQDSDDAKGVEDGRSSAQKERGRSKKRSSRAKDRDHSDSDSRSSGSSSLSSYDQGNKKRRRKRGSSRKHNKDYSKKHRRCDHHQNENPDESSAACSDEDSRSYSSDGNSYSSSSDDDSRRGRSKRKSIKRKHHRRDDEKKKKKKKKHHKKSSSSSPKKHKKERKRDIRENDEDKSNDSYSSGVPKFGKYGIIQATDFSRMQRSFQIWMAEVKGIPQGSFNGPKWEQQKYFAEFCEDYNTATMPHVKYYNYDKWEAEEYEKRQQQQQQQAMTGGPPAGEGVNAAWLDEKAHQEEQNRKRRAKQEAEHRALMSTMSAEKIADMKHQAAMKSQLQMAFKTGNTKEVQRLKERLGPDE